MTRRIVLCADDYGQAPEISQGIIALSLIHRLSATSCMVNSPYWREHAKWLSPFHSQIDIGLHFNLTEGNALSGRYIERYGESLFPLSTLMRQAFLHTLDETLIEAECIAQIDVFAEAMGFLPKFIDGHQHVHQFPVIRHALHHAYEKRLRSENAYVRLVSERIDWRDMKGSLKKAIIYASGTQALRRLLERHNIPHNDSFAGIYSFANADQYQTLFPHFLANVGSQGLIMCHPGLHSASETDVIAEARYAEYQYFAGPQFEEDCRQQNVSIERFY